MLNYEANINIIHHEIYTTKGKLIINEFGNGFVNVDNKSIYISKKNLSNSFHNEIVEIEYYLENGKYYGKVINYTLLNKIFIGKVHHFYKGNVYIYCNELKKSNLVEIKTNMTLSLLDWIEIKIISENNNKLIGEFIQKLDNDIDKLIEKKFKLNKIDDIQLNNIENNGFIESDRKDLRYMNTFTIDPPNSLDCDDAFSIEYKNDNIYIYVHISDTAHYINPCLANFEEIINRGNTFYGKNKNWPMIPEKYANDICSILPHKDTYVTTHKYIYDKNENKVIFKEWYYSVIESKNKYDYEYADIKLNELDENDFKILYESSVCIKKELKDFTLNIDSKSHEMIKYWMILTNQIMCEKLDKIYRYNPIPSEQKMNLIKRYIYYKYNINVNINDRDIFYNKLEEINNYSQDKLLSYLMKSLLQKAYYSTKKDNETHYGLGIDCYTHWTSPIRRSSDLLCHLLLKGYNIDYTKYIDMINQQELIQDDIEKFIILYNNNNKAVINKIYKGVIINITLTGIIVYINDFDNKFTLHISKLSSEKLIYDNISETLINNLVQYKLFDDINVKLNKIDVETFDFSVV